MKMLIPTIQPTARLLTWCASCVLLAACSSWPEPGRGGMAEIEIGAIYSVENKRPILAEHGLRLELEWLKNRLDILELRGARYCFPASVVELQLREHRLARELRSELLDDVSNDIIIQRQGVQKLENQMAHVLREAICEPPSPRDAELSQLGWHQRLDDLLNTDNQFASASAAVNPKYQRHLHAAAALLHDKLDISLLVVGHTDSTGARDANFSLSIQRANAVAAFLVQQGIDQQRIQVLGVADTQPQFLGQASEVRLVNRHVHIYILERKK